MHGLATVAGAAFVGPQILRAAEAGKDKLRVAFVATEGRAAGHVGDLILETKKATDALEICPCYCDVDQTHWAKIAKRQPDAIAYSDYRKMFDKHEKDFDAVFVATPDHNHAAASIRAMRAGKHVYCEKPLTWSVSEARLMAETAAKFKVATQMGNQGHANEGNRKVVSWVQGGVIGDVVEVHTWTNRPIWPQGIQHYLPKQDIPEGMDWDSWIGPAEMRDFGFETIKKADGKEEKHVYHPFGWRGWKDFGCGAIGDMGCHTWDCVYWSLQPDYPSTVELVQIVNASEVQFPTKSQVKWTYPAKGKRPGFVAYWYEGGLQPPTPEEMLNDPYYMNARKDKTKPVSLPGSGSLFIGTKGKLFVEGDYGNTPQLIPRAFQDETKEMRDKLPVIEKSPGHRQEFILAARGEKPWNYPGSNFSGYSGALTENMLLGSLAIKIGQIGFKIECDAEKREVKTKEAVALLSRQYRKGWEL